MLRRSRYNECLRLLRDVLGHELDAIADVAYSTRCSVAGLCLWARKHIGAHWHKSAVSAVRSLVAHGHIRGTWLNTTATAWWGTMVMPTVAEIREAIGAEKVDFFDHVQRDAMAIATAIAFPTTVQHEAERYGELLTRHYAGQCY